VTPNLTAFLAMVAQCEVGTADKTGYNILYGGGRFESYDDHPRLKITAGKYTSSAAGRYQILSSTWNDFIKAEGPHDFSPSSQDRCARWLLKRRGATADIEAGRLRAAITRCNKEWASLPGSPYGQPIRTLDYCERLFATHGGVQIDGNTVYRVDRTPVSDGQDTTLPNGNNGVSMSTKSPPKEPRMGATLLAGLLPSILSMFSGRAQAAITKATGASPEVAAKFTEDIARQIQVVSGVQVTDAASAMQAAGAIAADPAKVKALEEHATAFVLTEIGGGVQSARDEYAAINRDYDDDTYGKIIAKFVANPVNWVTGVFLFFIQQFVPALARKVEDLDGAAAMGLIVLVFAVLGVVSARWMGVYPKSKE
jgi:muramidase (phage lysozyme)